MIENIEMKKLLLLLAGLGILGVLGVLAIDSISAPDPITADLPAPEISQEVEKQISGVNPASNQTSDEDSAPLPEISQEVEKQIPVNSAPNQTSDEVEVLNKARPSATPQKAEERPKSPLICSLPVIKQLFPRCT